MSTILLACALIAIDGDTLRCGRERIRLIGIDAPELPGHCRRGRDCVPGDAFRSWRRLAGLADGAASIERFGFDRYGRTLATVTVRGQMLACAQLATSDAIYVPRWDKAGVVARRCRISRPATQ